MKNSSKPVYESALKNSVKDTGNRVYSYLPSSNYVAEKLKQKDPKYGLISTMQDN